MFWIFKKIPLAAKVKTHCSDCEHWHYKKYHNIDSADWCNKFRDTFGDPFACVQVRLHSYRFKCPGFEPKETK